MGNIRPVFFPFAPQSHNSFNSSFILLPTYYMPEILLGSREIPANKIERFCSHEFEFSWGREMTDRYTWCQLAISPRGENKAWWRDGDGQRESQGLLKPRGKESLSSAPQEARSWIFFPGTIPFMPGKLTFPNSLLVNRGWLYYISTNHHSTRGCDYRRPYLHQCRRLTPIALSRWCLTGLALLPVLDQWSDAYIEELLCKTL